MTFIELQDFFNAFYQPIVFVAVAFAVVAALFLGLVIIGRSLDEA